MRSANISPLLLLLASTTLAAPSPFHHLKRDEDTSSIDDFLPAIVPVNTRSSDTSLITLLKTAPTQVDRFKLLDQPGDFVFDFNPAAASAAGLPSTKGNGGVTVGATSKTFPALIGNGIAMTLAFLGPCGLNTPHVHPRGTELNIPVKGRLVTNFIQENEVSPIANTLSTYQMAIFPQGAIHTEFNPDCEDAVFVAAFPSEDPGVQTIAQNFFGLDGDIVGATLGGVATIDGEDLETFREMLPKNVALGVDECLSRCGIERNAKRSFEEYFASKA